MEDFNTEHIITGSPGRSPPSEPVKTDSQLCSRGEKMNILNQDSRPFCEIIKKSVLIEDRNPACYHLQTSIDHSDQSEPYRKMAFGERYKNKPHKTILMVGETGTGKTTLINVMINYMLGVQREDKVWFEITDDQNDHQSSVHSQTSIINVYGFYLQESPINLTIIDTPGYGDTCTNNLDKEIAKSFLRLSESAEGIHEIDAVCLVIMAHQNRLHERQRYIFDAFQSLFGKDIVENIVLLFTHSTGTQPKNALTAVKEAEIKCAVNDKNHPVFFLFNNRQSEAADEEYEMIQEQSWDHSSRRMEQFFTFLDKMKPKTLKMTQNVLRKWEELEAKIPHLKSCVQEMELKQYELKQTQEALEKDKNVIYLQIFKSEINVPNKADANIDPNITKEQMYCKICKQLCPESGMSKGIFYNIIGNNKCTACPKKCPIDNHTKDPKIHEPKAAKENNTNTDFKMEYDGKVRDGETLVKKLENELQELEKKKIKLVFDAFHCVDTLQMIAHKTDSLFTLQHIDVLIEKLKEINEPEKAKTLEDIKKKAREDKHRAVENMTQD